METGEKLYSIFAIVFIIALAMILIFLPEYRQLMVLLPMNGRRVWTPTRCML